MGGTGALFGSLYRPPGLKANFVMPTIVASDMHDTGVRPLQIGMTRPFRGLVAVSNSFGKESWSSRCSWPACVQKLKAGSTAKNADSRRFLYPPANSY